MRRRCLDPTFVSYPYYGGMGIKVDAKWADAVDGYRAFVADMGERPKGMTLDRRDPYGDYDADNCKWATPLGQSWNKKSNWNRMRSDEEASERAHWDEMEREYLEREVEEGANV